MQQVDVWGIGCVCLEMCLLQRFDYAYELAMDSKGIFDKVQDLYGEKMAQFLRACLVLKYEQRPSAEQVLQQFFNISISQVVPSTPTLEEVSIESESPSSMLKLENSFSTSKSDQSASARRKRMEEVLASMSKDVQILIFSFLPANSIAKCQLVCKGWYLLVTSSAYIWKQLFEYDYETKVNEKLERKYMQEYGSVRNAFSYRSNLERNWCSTNQYTFSAFKIEDTKHVHHVKIFQDEQLAKYLIEKYPPKIAAPTKKDSKRNQLASMADDSFAMTIKTEALMQGEQLMALTTTNNGAMQLHMISGLGTGLANPTIKHRMLHTFPDGHKHALWAVDYNRAKNEKLICTGGHDRDIMIWDILSGDSVHRFTTAHQNEIWDICFYTKTSVASVGQDKCIKVWDLTSKKELVNVPNVHEGGIYAVHYDEKEIFEHCLATGGAEGYAKITDLRVADKTNACVFIEPYAQMNGKGVYDVKWQGNKLCVGSGVGEVLVYDIRSLKLPIAQFVNDKEIGCQIQTRLQE